jgi:hypothetical protein
MYYYYYFFNRGAEEVVLETLKGTHSIENWKGQKFWPFVIVKSDRNSITSFVFPFPVLLKQPKHNNYAKP